MRVPEPLRLRARAAGAVGEAWLEGLPVLVEQLAAKWVLVPGAVLHGGTEALVIEAAMADGRAAVLKICPPFGGTISGELRTLAAAEGRGYAQLYRADEEHGAMLVERLGGQLAESGLPLAEQLKVICQVLRQAWEVPPVAELMNGAEKAASLAAFVEETWAELGRPCPRAVIDTALFHAEARARAFEPAGAVMAHGDAHAWNALETLDGGGYKFVDPDGLFIEPAYDLGISMREWTDELLAGDPLSLGRERCQFLSRLTGVAPAPIWQWGFIERVSTGLLCLRLGLDGGPEMLEVAKAWARG